ncbi:hypothetical protein WDZ92_39715 [Nostoc sp. NIES-2111]
MRDGAFGHLPAGEHVLTGWTDYSNTGDLVFESVDGAKVLMLQLGWHITIEHARILAQRIHDRFDGSGALFDPDGGGGGSRAPARRAA